MKIDKEKKEAIFEGFLEIIAFLKPFSIIDDVDKKIIEWIKRENLAELHPKLKDEINFKNKFFSEYGTICYKTQNNLPTIILNYNTEAIENILQEMLSEFKSQ